MEGIRAISNRAHISRHIDYALNRVRRPRLSYDQFWTESGGVLGTDGFYDLPIRHVRRDDSEIKSSKRSAYHQRYAMLDAVGEGIQASLARVARGVSTSRDRDLRRAATAVAD